MYVLRGSAKRWNINPSLNCLRLISVERRCAGREFQTIGVATGKLRRPSSVLVRGTSMSWRSNIDLTTDHTPKCLQRVTSTHCDRLCRGWSPLFTCNDQQTKDEMNNKVTCEWHRQNLQYKLCRKNYVRYHDSETYQQLTVCWHQQAGSSFYQTHTS